MKFSESLFLAFLCAIQTLVLNCQIVELCDVEGSGIDDCSINAFCCKQSQCDKAYDNDDNKIDEIIDLEYDLDENSNRNVNQKCCGESATKESNFSGCKICTKCCDEVERNKVPFPLHCSKCKICGNTNRLTTGKDKEVLYTPFSRV